VEALQRREGLQVRRLGRDHTQAELTKQLRQADVIYHLAGVNRPQDEAEYATGNAGFTHDVCSQLRGLGRSPTLVLASSTQALLDNPYGNSKRQAEEYVCRFVDDTSAAAVVFRLPNVFGKWCRPNYNSVVATLCHNIAVGLPITISDPAREVTFVYIDDVTDAFVSIIEQHQERGICRYAEVAPTYTVTLGALAEKIEVFREIRRGLILPDFADRFTRCLYATYLAYLDTQDFAYPLEIKADQRGELAEFVKSQHIGQIFLSRTKPGAVRGNHYHHTKIEKFLVLEGQAIIRFRHLRTDELLEYPVSGPDFRVVDIPPGYTHSIQNVGDGELVVLFWANEVFDPQRPDTYYSEVLRN
jgi:UDP-2-acetamido-2,6-beta-L-arabino-hexul-4-ose reductase